VASRGFPGWFLGEQFLEPGDLLGHVVTRVGAGEELGQGLLEEPLLRLAFLARVDRVEEHAVDLGGLAVAGGVAHYQVLALLVAPAGRQRPVLPLAPELLPGDQGDVLPR
jgi:hypothetical protein